MQVTVTYNSPFIGAICRDDGLWLVTTHAGKIVKAQKVEREKATEDGVEGRPGRDGLGPYRDVVRRASQADVLAQMLTQNTQWLVEVKDHAICSADRIDKPLGVNTGSEEDSKGNATRPTATAPARAKRTTKAASS